MRTFTLSVAAVILLAGAPAAAQDDEAPFEPTGEVRFMGYGTVGSGATFDETRVVGPNVNMSRTDDGAWAGDLSGLNMALEIAKDRIKGSNVNIEVTRKDALIKVEGLFFGARVNLELDPRRFHGRFGACSVDLNRKGIGPYQGNVGCQRANMSTPQTSRASLVLIGDAGVAQPPLTQLAIALLAVLPG